MRTQVLEAWVSPRLTQTMPLSCLKGSMIGVDAIYYLATLLVAHREPLLSALGGFPLGLEHTIKNDLDNLRSSGVQLHFVFNGLDFGSKEDPFVRSTRAADVHAHAFETYEQDQAQEAIKIFKTSGVPTPAQLVPFLKKVLHEHDVPFTVAPYSALPQLVYYEKHPSQFIDAVYGPSELFLFGIDKLITKFDLLQKTHEIIENGHPIKRTEFDLDAARFVWIDRKSCVEDLGRIPVEVFQDACLLSGSTFLVGSFPPLHNPALFPKGHTFRDVVNLIMAHGRSVVRLCAHHSADPLVEKSNYMDRYKRAMTSIRFHPVITKEGDIEPLNKNYAPTDVHACVGYRLPEELNMYLSRGMLRPSFLGALNSGTVAIAAPFDGGDSPVYRNLVKAQLRPLREETLALLAESLNFYYQRARDVTTRLWFEPDSEVNIAIKNLLPSREIEISAWNVRADAIVEQRRVLEANSDQLVPGTFCFAIRSLADNSFAAKTITTKPSQEDKLLKTRHEVTSNVIWRFLQLRGYINKKHQLTHWGKVLEASLSVVGSNKDQEEATLVAIELLRLNLLNADTMFVGYSGAPVHGSEVDKRNCMLVSRVASLARLRHQSRGYRGPLSRHLLAYHSIASTLHSSLRDSLEISLATMFLKGHVDRARDDWVDLALSLPLYEEHSCALGVVMMNYLDELDGKDTPTAETTREQQKHLAVGWVANGDFLGSLQDALQLWDAVYKGVTLAGQEVPDRKMWDEANEWLSQRR